MSNPVSGGCAAVAMVVFAVGGVGCTSLQPLADNAQSLATEVEPGAKLHIVTVDGKKHELRVTGAEGGTVSGIERGGGRRPNPIGRCSGDRPTRSGAGQDYRARCRGRDPRLRSGLRTGRCKTCITSLARMAGAQPASEHFEFALDGGDRSGRMRVSPRRTPMLTSTKPNLDLRRRLGDSRA